MRVRIIGSTILRINALGSDFFSLVTAGVGAGTAAVTAAILTAGRAGSGTAEGGGGDWYGWFPPAVAPPNSPVFGSQLSVLPPFPQGPCRCPQSSCHSVLRFFSLLTLPRNSNLGEELLSGCPDLC